MKSCKQQLAALATLSLFTLVCPCIYAANQIGHKDHSKVTIAASSSLCYVVAHHEVVLPPTSCAKNGVFVVAKVDSLKASLSSQNLLIFPLHACQEQVASCDGPGLYEASADKTAQSLTSPPVTLRLTPLHAADSSGRWIWWIERVSKDGFARDTCAQPFDELWPLFVDGTAHVSQAATKDPAQLLHPFVVDLRHAAKELEPKGLQAIAGNKNLDAPDCRDYGPMPAPRNLAMAGQPMAVWHAATTKKKIALTFDACSTFAVGRFNPLVIDALEKNQVPATLFVGGDWADMFPGQLEQLAQNALFELGNHSYSHPHMRDLPKEQQRQELLWTQQLIYTRTGVQPRLFRPPYGEVDDVMLRETARAGLVTVEYDLPAGDADVHVSAVRLTHWVEQKANAGSIVIMHMNRPGNHTAEALPSLVAHLRNQGFVFCTISGLIDEGMGPCQ